MGYEVLTAFFLEAGFLGVMLFGLNRVGKGLHFARHLLRRLRHAALGLLDHRREFLDAHAGGLRAHARGPVPAGGLVGGDLQPVLPLSLPARRIGRLPDHGLHRRRGRRLAPAARQRQPPCAADVLHGDVDGADRRTRAGGDRRPARAQHAGTPARRRSRRWKATGRNGARARRCPLRAAEHGGGTQRPRARHPRPRQPDPRPFLGGRDRRPQGLPARGAADQRAARLLVLPRDGRDRAADDRARHRGLRAAAARAALHDALAAPLRAGDGALRAGRGDGGLDRHRGRAAALHGLRAAAHRRQRLAHRGTRGGDLARDVRRRLFRRLRRRHLAAAAADGRAPHPAQEGPAEGTPIRTAGITPAPAHGRAPRHPAGSRAA
jgi:hypothetical protein